MSRLLRFDPEKVRQAFAVAPGSTMASKVRSAAAALGCSQPTVIRAVKRREGNSQSKSVVGPSAFGIPKDKAGVMMLAVGHPAIQGKRTLFPTTVRDVGSDMLLKSGENSPKIGRRVTKGPWKGFQIFTLTLEERATCPTSCKVYASCYGNHMPFARRFRHGAELEWRLEREISALELDNRGGFAVRLHTLGDFYSVDYVEFWRRMLARHAALHVFGYTARSDVQEDEIAYALAMMVRDFWTRCDPPRFAVRFSNAPVFTRSTLNLENPVQKPRDAILCPAQWTPSGKKAGSCAECALCWGSIRRVAFLQH